MATVLGNLIDNGIDAVMTGEPAGAAGCGWRSGSPTPPWSSSVTDSGPGLAAELATEVFEHGYTTKAAQQAASGGSASP